MLIKPERITIKTYVAGQEENYMFRIGRYDGLNGLELIEYATDILKNGLNLTNSTRGLLKECMIKMGKYIEAVSVDDKGNEVFVPLDNELVLQAYLPNVEVSMRLMMELHDYNTFFLNSANLLKESASWLTKLQQLIVKTLIGSQDT